VRACLVLMKRAEGAHITTIEGLAGPDGQLHPIQRAYIEQGATQCGFCTPGFIMATTAFLAKSPSPTPDEVKLALSGNLCRCGNYAKIYKAVTAAAAKMKGA
jgi:carbon-monoxide dehydrogenase small subunit